jgi:hypothetical protein
MSGRAADILLCIRLTRTLSAQSILTPGLATDPKTRKDWAKFTHLVDRTLQSFENVSEWADFITFLGKLLKVRLAQKPIIDHASRRR